MKHLPFFVFIISLIIYSCAPSDSAIQTAIAETKSAQVISTSTSIKTPTLIVQSPTALATKVSIAATPTSIASGLEIDYAISFRSGKDETSQEIEVMNADGSDRQSLYSGGWGSFDWSPDGKQLILVEQGKQGASQIVLWDIDTGTKNVVISEEIESSGLMTRYYGYLTPRFLSDQDVYFLVLYPRVGSDIRRSNPKIQNTNLPLAIIQNWVGRNGLDISTSGVIAFQTFGNSPPNLGNGLSIFDTANGKTTVLIPIQYTNIGTPSWSPDGEWIAFSASSNEKNIFEGQPSIWMMKRDGSELHKVISGESNYALEDPAWSPDGKWIAFSKVKTNDSSSDIWVASIDGKNIFNITNTPDISERNSSWRPVQASSDATSQDIQITQEEFAVYNAVVSNSITPWDNLVVIQNETIPNISLPELSKGAQEKINSIEPNILDEFKRINEIVYEIPEYFALPKPYILISFDEYEKYAQSNESWDQYFFKYPDTSALRRLSRVSFNKQGNIALVFYENGCHDYCNVGVYFLLVKSEGLWIQQDVFQ